MASILYPENAPGNTWMNLNIDSKPLSIKWAKLYSNCWARCISTKFKKILVKKSNFYLSLSALASYLSNLRPIYPQTPPIFGWLIIVLYILHKAFPSGLRPTSNKILYFGDIPFNIVFLSAFLPYPALA